MTTMGVAGVSQPPIPRLRRSQFDRRDERSDAIPPAEHMQQAACSQSDADQSALQRPMICGRPSGPDYAVDVR